MSKQLQLLKQELKVSQILRTYGKQFSQIIGQYSDGHDGRCVMSYYGWDIPICGIREESNIHQFRKHLHQNTISRIQIHYQRVC